MRLIFQTHGCGGIMHALIALSFELKKQHIGRYSVRPYNRLAAVAVVLDEVALLHRATPLLGGPCMTFLSEIERLVEPSAAVASMWAKAQVGLDIKLARIQRLGQHMSPWQALLKTKKEAMVDAMTTVRQRNQILSTMLRCHPRATERGFRQSDQWSGVVQRALQRLSIDVAVLDLATAGLSDLAKAPTEELQVPKAVSFDARGPQVMGTADCSVDRASTPVSMPRSMEMLLIRGSRFMPAV
ncbi:Aste57867_7067 [Aphanomyces stellatus]|uniref:Aste57867_7067 protein n=1 Tax=Aphanomyces stellatus TaxID=120398 RepID=A0A485KEX5_9STRA|nr:hypothetical protein As57867_007044 [Aphanomyces stellatus]VFT84009.1 Aste57867_7067 [Aphanomyces stellatus]